MSIEVRDASDLRKYRTEIPNLVLEIGLSPHALALYVHFKRTAGQDGACWKSTRRLAEDVCMSVGKISESRKELETRELIVVERPNNRSKSMVVTIVDVWDRNFLAFSSCSEYAPSVQNANTRVHNTNAPCSEYEPRKEPYRKEPSKNPTGGASGDASTEQRTEQQLLVDQLYDAVLEKHGVTLTRDQYNFHLGRFKLMLEKNDPLDDEKQRVVKHMLNVLPRAPKIDALMALQDVRFGRDEKKSPNGHKDSGGVKEGYEWLFA